jgi:hypothetical protein
VRRSEAPPHTIWVLLCHDTGDYSCYNKSVVTLLLINIKPCEGFTAIERPHSDRSIWHELYGAYTKEFLDIRDAPNGNSQSCSS